MDNIIVCDEVNKKEYEWGVLRIIKNTDHGYEMIIHEEDFNAITELLNLKNEVEFVDENESKVTVTRTKYKGVVGFLFSCNLIEAFISEELFLDI